MSSQQNKLSSLSIFDVFLPIIVLLAMLSSAVYLFGDGASSGPNQIALLFASMSAWWIAYKHGSSWSEIESYLGKAVADAVPALLILLAVGALIANLIAIGTVPSLIYYGLGAFSPTYFYLSVILLCALVSVIIGSSWTTAGTIGVALVGVALGLGLSPAITAGAIISGAYFGDKLSPLSETTNLAASVAQVPLFQHIRFMLTTTIPSFVIACVFFLFLGFSADPASVPVALQQAIESHYSPTVWSVVPLVGLFILVAKKVPALLAILLTSMGCSLWLITQGQPVTEIWQFWVSGYEDQSGIDALADLLSRGGMASFLNTIWLILSAMVLGASLEKAGILKKLVTWILRGTQSAASMVRRTIFTAIGLNIVAADQYISIVLPGRMYRQKYADENSDARTLSRALEEGGTITSPLVPWNTCGAYMASVLGVATLDYFAFCAFNIANVLIALIFARILSSK